MVQDAIKQMREQIGDLMTAEDMANAILYALSQPERVSVNEILVRPTKQQR
jgi:NADP-dependent 3-hydroxy acid dehydrogenase YdfG